MNRSKSAGGFRSLARDTRRADELLLSALHGATQTLTGWRAPRPPGDTQLTS
jgi:hypothetical protein